MAISHHTVQNCGKVCVFLFVWGCDIAGLIVRSRGQNPKFFPIEMLKLWSIDYASLVLARALLRREPKLALQIYLGGDRPEGSYSFTDFIPEALKNAPEKFSRMALVSDITSDIVAPENIVSVQTEMLEAFANRGLVDTVEFRRLARKYLRRVRNANCQVALFVSGILADEKSQKILSQILGTQVKPIFLTDFIPPELFTPADKQSIEIFTSRNLDRVHAEAEDFLHTKLTKASVKER